MADRDDRVSEDAQFHATVARRDVVAVVELRGELDLETAKDLSWAVEEALHQGLDCADLDTSHLTFMDSSGLTAIVRARQQIREHGQQFRISGVQPWLRRLLERTGLLDVLGVERQR